MLMHTNVSVQGSRELYFRGHFTLEATTPNGREITVQYSKVNSTSDYTL
jgi:hypothetical protein